MCVAILVGREVRVVHESGEALPVAAASHDRTTCVLHLANLTFEAPALLLLSASVTRTAVMADRRSRSSLVCLVMSNRKTVSSPRA